jgi:hypothetical protein
MESFTKGMLIPMGGASPIIFQWNPATIKYSRAANWHSLPAAGNNQPFLQYTCGGANLISFTIDVSRYNNSDFFVRGTIGSLVALASTSQSGSSSISSPPKVMFISGDSLSVLCVVDKVAVNFGIRANPETLLPYEAKINITLMRVDAKDV